MFSLRAGLQGVTLSGMRTLQFLLGSLVVYGVVASCGNSVDPVSTRSSSTAPPGVTSPVPVASAQETGGSTGASPSAPASPTVVSTTCDKTFLSPTGSVQHYYAEASFPGKTMIDLTRVVVLARPVAIAGYDWATMGFAHVKDGYAAYYCGNTASVLPTEVRFVLP